MTLAKVEPQLWQRRLTRFFPHIAVGVALIVVPPFLPTYYQIVLTKVLIFGLFVASLDVIYGYTGLFSMGHAAFFGVGGYTAGILMVRYGVNSFWLSIPLAILMSVVVASVFGIIVLRTSGVYLLIITFALGELLVSAATKWGFLSTQVGTEGVLNIVPPELGLPFTWNYTNFYYFVLVVFVICLFMLYRFLNSPFGHTLRGIREDEPRMRALGYNTWLHKYIAYIVAALFAGVAGVLIAYHNGFMVPSSFGVMNSAFAMLMVIIGGAGTLYGPVIGAAVIIFVEFFASTYTPERWPLILGGTFVLAVMYARGGIIVYLARFWKKVLAAWKS